MSRRIIERGPMEHERHDAQATDPRTESGEPDLSVPLQLLKRLEAAHRSFYTFKTNHEYHDRAFPFYGEYHAHGTQFVLVKRAELWSADTHDYLFMDARDVYGPDDFERDVTYLVEEASNKAVPKKDHMSSGITLVVAANHVDDQVMRSVRAFKHRKNHLLGFHGWTDVRMAVADVSRPSNQAVATNTAAKELKSVIASNLDLLQTR